MFICAAGDIHGAMDRLYDDVLVFEESLGACFDYVLHVGDFGIWPDPNRVDRTTRKHDLTYLPNGDVIDIGANRGRIRIGGIGGCHGPSNYGRRMPRSPKVCATSRIMSAGVLYPAWRYVSSR